MEILKIINSWLGTWQSLITVVISGVIIFFAYKIPRRVLTNQIFSNLLKEYRSDRMGVAVKKLWEFFEHTCNGDRNKIETFIEIIVNEYKRIYREEIESGKKKTLKDLQNTLHFHRRIVSQYYQQLARLCSHTALTGYSSLPLSLSFSITTINSSSGRYFNTNLNLSKSGDLLLFVFFSPSL